MKKLLILLFALLSTIPIFNNVRASAYDVAFDNFNFKSYQIVDKSKLDMWSEYADKYEEGEEIPAVQLNIRTMDDLSSSNFYVLVFDYIGSGSKNSKISMHTSFAKMNSTNINIFDMSYLESDKQNDVKYSIYGSFIFSKTKQISKTADFINSVDSANDFFWYEFTNTTDFSFYTEYVGDYTGPSKFNVRVYEFSLENDLAHTIIQAPPATDTTEFDSFNFKSYSAHAIDINAASNARLVLVENDAYHIKIEATVSPYKYYVLVGSAQFSNYDMGLQLNNFNNAYRYVFNKGNDWNESVPFNNGTYLTSFTGNEDLQHPKKTKTSDYIYSRLQTDFCYEQFIPKSTTSKLVWLSDIPYNTDTIKSLTLYEFSLQDDMDIPIVPGLEDNEAPVISGVQYMFISNFDNPFTLEEILENVKAYDETDGYITDRIVVDTDGGYALDLTAGTLTLKDYSVALSVSDNAGNKATFNFKVRVVDVTAPVITGKTEYDAKNNQRILVDDFKVALQAVDNYDGILAKSRIVLVSNNYSDNYSKLGTYYLTYKVTDLSGNESTCTITVNVTDGTPPKYYKPGTTTVIVTETSVVKKTSVILTISDIINEYIKCIDDIDGVITTFSIESDNYTGNGSIAGTYQVTIKATDSAGNNAYHTITINNNDSIPPIFIVSNFFIVVKADTILTQSDYIEILRALGHFDGAQSFVSLNLELYEENATTPGTYPIEARIRSLSGTEQTLSFSVIVEPVEDGVDIPGDEEEVKKDFDYYLDKAKEFYNDNKTIILVVLIGLGALLVLSYLKKNQKRSSKKRTYKKRK